jgi:DNA recombination protein RmuC
MDELGTKEKLIDQTLTTIKTELQRVENRVVDFDKGRENSFGSVSKELGKLQETTLKLQTAFANNRARGQWGERMAEDVLRYAGFIEGVNYLKQRSMETVSTRPDYTFLLPQNMKVNMDVKFPSENYTKCIVEDSDTSKEVYRQQFLKDVRQRIKEVTSRDYINPGENTVDYVLVFIPNEQIYCFINENDNTIIDDALKNKVILCSPLTLYAILAIIRQAMDNFIFAKTTNDIQLQLKEFEKQWESYKEGMDNIGKRIDAAKDEYVKLITVRNDKLERPLRRIEELRMHQNAPGSLPDDNSTEDTSR